MRKLKQTLFFSVLTIAALVPAAAANALTAVNHNETLLLDD